MDVGKKTMILGRLVKLSLAGRIIALAGVVLLCWVFVLPLAFVISGSPGILGSAVAAFVCLLGGEAGLLVASCFRGSASGMNGALVATIVRMAISLSVGVGLQIISPWLAATGMIFYLIAFYMVDLAAETLLLIAALSSSASMSRGSA